MLSQYVDPDECEMSLDSKVLEEMAQKQPCLQSPRIQDVAITNFILALWGSRFKVVGKKLHGGGGGFFRSKETWGYAACKSILFRTSSLAKGIVFCNFSRVSENSLIIFSNLRK